MEGYVHWPTLVQVARHPQLKTGLPLRLLFALKCDDYRENADREKAEHVGNFEVGRSCPTNIGKQCLLITVEAGNKDLVDSMLVPTVLLCVVEIALGTLE